MIRSKSNEIANFIGIPKLLYFRKYLLSYQYVEQIIIALFDRYSPSHGSLNSSPIVAYGYRNWELRLFESDVFNTWVQALSLFNKTAKHNLGFLLTPTSNSNSQDVMFSQIENAMRDNNFIFQTTSNELDNLFKNKLRPRNQWANSGDAHPGMLQSSFFATAAVKLLIKLGLNQ